MHKRRVEVLRDEQWVEIPFEDIQIGETFRMWQLVIEHDSALDADVVAWKCESAPLEMQGSVGCHCKPAITVPHAVASDEELAENQGA